MSARFQLKNRVVSLLIVLAVLVLAACGGSDDENGKQDSEQQKFVVGVLCHSASVAPTVDGFKEGMAELGYVEGENITYIYDGPTGSIDTLEPALDTLLTQHLDLLLTIGTPPTSLAKQKLEGKDIPVIFAPVNDPLADGFVQSIGQPGGIMTGIKNSDSIGKSLDWLQQIVPDVKRVFVPHNPKDQSSVHSVTELQAAADQFGIELVISEASTPEEIAALTTSVPEDVDAVFIVRSGTISAKVPEFVQTATALGIPVFASTTGEFVDLGVLVAYGSSYFSSGKQAARLADQVLRGASPAELPVEVAESSLGINMITAEALGIEFPDTVLRQATQIVRAAE